jgi:hypothetical protein
MKRLPILLALLMPVLALPAPLQETAGARQDVVTADGLRRCVGPDGVPIFTDRRCVDLQAADAVAKAEPEQPGVKIIRVRSCARNQDDLLMGVRSALETHDPNRLADYYHWTGMDSVQGYRLLDRLASFSARPLVDVQLVRSPEPAETPAVALATDVLNGADPLSAPVHHARIATLLRVDQMRGEANIASETTYFHLLNNAGCWWMQF